MRRWAELVTRRAWSCVGIWLVASVAVFIPAPEIPSLLKDDATGFLPAEMPSRVACATLREEFPENSPGSRCAIVIARTTGLTPNDEDYLGSLAQTLATRGEEFGWRIHSAALTPYLHAVLASPDGQAAVLVVDLPAEPLTHHSVRRVREVKSVLAADPPPPGLQVELTGGAAMGELLDSSAKRDVDRTTLWAFAAVAVILLLIYRSPIAMFLPLVTIAVALMVSLGALGWAASRGWPINGLVQMFIIVLVAGAGVDYCLFLFARFREELVETQGDATEATRRAVAHAGGAILASAATVAVGLATMVLARNRDLYTSGVSIAFAVMVAVFAVLSLTPAIMRIVGVRLVRLRGGGEVAATVADGWIWRWAARLVTRFPGSISVVMTMALVAGSLVSVRVPTLYDSMEEFPADSSFVRGATLFVDHFYDGRSVNEMTLVLSSEAAINSDSLRPLLEGISNRLRERFSVAYIRDLGDPLGTDRAGNSEASSSLGPLLGTRFGEKLIEGAYVGKSGNSTRIDVGFFTEPRTLPAILQVEQVRAALDSDVLREFRLGIAGEPATYADMRDLRRRDFTVIGGAASVLIYVILLALLRAPVQSLVLLVATLLTYFATYGSTYLIVRAWLGLDGLSWQIHFLLFVIIMSLGQDYNIFVVARIHEELRTKPPREAIEVAVRRTGKVVSSCGLIMAATFASMFAGSLLVLKQFAIALPLGILIDTFLVRPLLVPAVILLLLEHRSGSRRVESCRPDGHRGSTL